MVVGSRLGDRVVCSVCKRSFAPTKSGKVRRHLEPKEVWVDPDVTCQGSGRMPSDEKVI